MKETIKNNLRKTVSVHIKYRGKSCANFDPELIMLTLSLCDPPCHTQNEKAPDHRTAFHGADVDPLMEEITCIRKYTDL